MFSRLNYFRFGDWSLFYFTFKCLADQEPTVKETIIVIEAADKPKEELTITLIKVDHIITKIQMEAHTMDEVMAEARTQLLRITHATKSNELPITFFYCSPHSA